jgi:hypothetical protein
MVQKRIESDDEKNKFVGQKSDLGVIPFSVCFVWRSQKNWVRINTTKEKTHARLGLQQQQKNGT